MRNYYIVESASRGCLVEISQGKGRCKYSILRTDKQVMKFYNLDSAKMAAKTVKGSYVLLFVFNPKQQVTRLQEAK